MAELEFNTTISHIQRGRDVYKVHDAARNRKKQKKGENEKEFMEMLNEHEKDVEDFTPQANANGRENLPTNHMLNQMCVRLKYFPLLVPTPTRCYWCCCLPLDGRTSRSPTENRAESEMSLQPLWIPFLIELDHLPNFSRRSAS